MTQVAPGTKVCLASRPVSMRYGFDGLRAKVANVLQADPLSGHLFLFRSKRADYLKILYRDGQRRSTDRRAAGAGAVRLAADRRWLPGPAQLALLIEAIDWRRMVPPPLPATPTAT